MNRTAEDLARAADAAGAVLLSTHVVTRSDGSATLGGRFAFEDPWAAARLLAILSEEDGQDPDPMVYAWATRILHETAAAGGLSADDPDLLDAFVEAVHANVQTFIAFAPEEGERFQSAETTMIEGVGDCDCHARLVHALCRSMGAHSEICFFESEGEPVHAVAAVGTQDGPAWAETTIAAAFGEHPQDAYRRLGLDRSHARPDIGAGPTHDDVVALQTRLQDAYLATALAVEACPALPAAAQLQWSTLAKSVLAWDSADPDSLSYDAGQALAQQIDAFAGVLRAAGCQAPIPAPIPQPPQPQAGTPNPLLGAAKVISIAVAVAAGAIAIVKVAAVVGGGRRRAVA